MARTRKQLHSGDTWEEGEERVKSWDEWVIQRKDMILRRELHKSEYLLLQGRTIAPYWYRERLQNEAAALAYIQANTSIPVPRVHRLYHEESGALCLEMDRIQEGVQFSKFLDDAKREVVDAATEAVERQMNEEILPQLRSLRRDFIGSVDKSLPIFPPVTVYAKDRRRDWPRITAESNEFVFCHTGLDPSCIMIDPDTYKITGITRWDSSGFFPPFFERRYWRMRSSKYAFAEEDLAACPEEELAFFGLTADQLVDDSFK